MKVVCVIFVVTGYGDYMGRRRPKMYSSPCVVLFALRVTPVLFERVAFSFWRGKGTPTPPVPPHPRHGDACEHRICCTGRVSPPVRKGMNGFMKRRGEKIFLDVIGMFLFELWDCERRKRHLYPTTFFCRDEVTVAFLEKIRRTRNC